MDLCYPFLPHYVKNAYPQMSIFLFFDQCRIIANILTAYFVLE